MSWYYRSSLVNIFVAGEGSKNILVPTAIPHKFNIFVSVKHAKIALELLFKL